VVGGRIDDELFSNRSHGLLLQPLDEPT